jgi:hypothetical protein
MAEKYVFFEIGFCKSDFAIFVITWIETHNLICKKQRNIIEHNI